MLDLRTEFLKLNENQREAVTNNGNTVVLAGPGSGKTATLVLKVAHLLADVLPEFGAVACITYNNDAVREVKRRFVEFGIYPGRRLFLGTVHSFCLNCILRPYAALIGPEFKDGVSVAGPRHAELLLEKALSRAGIAEKVEYYTARFTRLRRKKICGEDLSDFDDSDMDVLAEYEKLLALERLVDFESMIGIASEMLSANDWIRDLIACRFPWLVVDEYQDLGGPLHRIVTTAVRGGANVFAVGDPDQTIYDFTGANPKYLDDLSKRSDFRGIRLKFNYRSGRRLIDASQAALSPPEPRGYAPDPAHSDLGEVFFLKCEDFENHAAKAVRAVEKAISDGIKPEEVAIFYLKRNLLLPELRAELEKAQIDYIAERDSKYPSSRIIRWLQDAAAWQISAPVAREHLFDDILRHYATILITSGQIEGDITPLDVRLSLFEALSEPVSANSLLSNWLRKMDRLLSLRSYLAMSEEWADDLEAFDDVMKSAESGRSLADAKLTDFASEGRIRGKVVLTTFHSSKGRQFDWVVIPGLAEGILPAWKWSRQKGRYIEPSPQSLDESRRLFYVGFTRARKTVCLVYSRGYVYKGHLVSHGVSRFATEISKKLRSA